jgi:hypothetical protein
LDDGPPAGVLERVVMLAQQLEVLSRSVTPVGVVDGVVVLAGPRRCMTSRRPARTVPGGDPPLQLFAWQPPPRISLGRRVRRMTLTPVIGSPVRTSTNPSPPATSRDTAPTPAAAPPTARLPATRHPPERASAARPQFMAAAAPALKRSPADASAAVSPLARPGLLVVPSAPRPRPPRSGRPPLSPRPRPTGGPACGTGLVMVPVPGVAVGCGRARVRPW